MNKFTRGIIIGSVLGTTLGMIGLGNSMWMKNRVLKPGRKAIKKASRVMNDVAKAI